MTNENTGPRLSAADLFGTRRGNGSHDLLNSLVHTLDTNPNPRLTLRMVGAFRSEADEASCAKLDRYFVERIATFEGARQELERNYEHVKAKLVTLLSPPFYPARYLGAMTTPSGEYARVVQDGTQRLVAFGEDLARADVSIGDQVILCNERNVAIAKTADAFNDIGEIATVVRTIDDAHLVINDRDTEIVVASGAKLAGQSLKPGDLVLLDRAARLAIDRLEQTSGLEYEDFDDTPPQRLGGHDAVLERVLRKFVFSIANPEVAKIYGVRSDHGRRLLLAGPPGTGKTLLMKVIASAVSAQVDRRCRVVSINGAELFSPYVGQTEQNIKRCFTTLADYDGPGILFLDEVDAIGRIRGHSSGWHDDRFLNAMLGGFEGVRRNDIAIIAATNRADALDPAFRARFAWEIEMPRPNMAAAREIFGIHLDEDIPYGQNVEAAPSTRELMISAGLSRLYDPNAENSIAKLQFRDGKQREIKASELVSGRLIEQICVAVREAGFERHCRGEASGVCVEDMIDATDGAIDRLRRTLTVQNAKSYLADLPQDVDVVSVEALRPRIRTSRYVQ